MHLLSVQILLMMIKKILIITSKQHKEKVLILFYNMTTGMIHKKFQAVVKGLFIRCRKVNIPLNCISQSYFSVPKDVWLTSIHCLIMKINNKRELQNTAINHSAYFVKIYRKCTSEPYFFWQLIQCYQQVIF